MYFAATDNVPLVLRARIAKTHVPEAGMGESNAPVWYPLSPTGVMASHDGIGAPCSDAWV